MKHFFKLVFASMLGSLLSLVFLIFLAIGAMSALLYFVGSEKKVDIVPNSVIVMRLNYPIRERTTKNPLQELNIARLNKNKVIGLNDILTHIHQAKNDTKIRGIYLELSSIEAGLATLEEIRNALIDFKKSSKFVIAYGEIYTQKAYYLASIADKIYLNPEGLLELRGFHTKTMFLKGALEKLEIDPQVIKIGAYKSAVEPFILDKMSEANRKQVTSYLYGMYNHFLSTIALSRKIPQAHLYVIADSLKVRKAADALKYKLVDGLCYKDEVLKELKLRTNTPLDEDPEIVSIERYYGSNEVNTKQKQPKIAIVYASGDIVSGEGDEQTMGSERISKAIRKARLDKEVKAVVLRVNSPGGSSIASDVIWREASLTRKIKPVVVSMGDLAASGGYYIACGADSIFAEPTTITGSIGVFGIIPNLKKFFNHKLGITFDGVKTGKYADLGDLHKPLANAERLVIQNEITRIYHGFVQRVAKGRKKSLSHIYSIAQGRVWTGSQAVKNGLVDHIGGVDRAISCAAGMAKLKHYTLVDYPALKDPIQLLLSESTDEIKAYIAHSQLGEQYKYLEDLKNALRHTGIQARLPYELVIE